ncbi:hypothetical protein E4U40_007271, partial [Claviceps sp. LM458 group G5]
CDLARPGCQRCVKYGVECPGYREQHELVFRNADPTAVAKRKKRASAKVTEQDGTKAGSSSSSSSKATTSRATSRAARTSSTTTTVFELDPNASLSSALMSMPPSPAASSPSSLSSWSSSSSSSSSSSDDTRPPLPRGLTDHWTNHSVPILLTIYSTFGFLHDLYKTNPGNGPLIWAAHLFSRTYVTNVRYPVHVCNESALETQRELGTYMGKTLSAVNAALNDPAGAFRDDVLATVWILANYELLVGSVNRAGLSSPWHLHTRGLNSILQTRGVNQLNTLKGRMAFWPCYNIIVSPLEVLGPASSGASVRKPHVGGELTHLLAALQQIQAMVSITECPPESDTWLGIIKNSLYDGEEHSLHVSVYIKTCTHIMAAISGILHQRDFAAGAAQYESLVQQLEVAEEQVDHFVATGVDCTQELAFYLRNLYWGAVIKGHTYILCLANFLTHDRCGRLRLPPAQLSARRAHCLHKIRAAAQCIIESNLAALSRLRAQQDRSPKILFDALRMVWSLTTVYVSAPALAEQRTQAQAALMFIGKEIGVRQALHTGVEGGGALPPEARLPLRLEVGEDATPAFVD